MAHEQQQITIPSDPASPLTLINISHQNIVKLTSTNYLSWKLHIETILIGYDLHKFIDGSHPCPSATTHSANQDTQNPDFLPWIQQDKLLFGALVGFIFAPLIPLIQQSSTSCDAWLTLTNTFAHPSHGHIKQIKDQLKHAIKGSQTMIEYMQFIKCHVNQLAALGKPLDHEDLIEIFLDGLYNDYKTIANIVHNPETPILFDELHEKSINHELTLNHLQSSHS